LLLVDPAAKGKGDQALVFGSANLKHFYCGLQLEGHGRSNIIKDLEEDKFTKFGKLRKS
jgi:hypothetical protein